MQWFVLFLFLAMINAIATIMLVPWTSLEAYRQCRKPWDYWLAVSLYISIPIIALIEHIRIPHTAMATWRFYGTLLYVGGSALWIWARRVNPFFLPITRKPHWIVTNGPYRFVRHPSYLGIAILTQGMAIMLDSLFAFIPAFIYWALLFRRAQIENDLLEEMRDGEETVLSE